MAMLLSAGAAAAQPSAPSPTPGEAVFNIFVKGTEIGRERVTLSRASSGWIITSTGRQAPPVDLTISRFELKYTIDWQPIDLRIEATVRNAPITLATSFTLTSAINEITQNGTTNSKTDQISARAVVVPNNFYAGYEALAVRLAGTEAGAEVAVYVVPQTEIRVKVRSIAPQTLDTPAGPLVTRRYDVTFQNPGAPLDGTVTVDSHSRLVRFELPAAGLQVVRDDAASVATRQRIARNPTDADVTIPANGFDLAGTLTTPVVGGRLRFPAIVLVGGSGPTDRDETVAGIAIFAQLAKSLADAGFLVVRYDKRGVGQSGGRIETATLIDYADDAMAVVKWIAARGDVDKGRVAIAGHSEGGAVALIAASRLKTVAAVIAIAAPGTTGAELILEQQALLLDSLGVPAAEKQAKIALQKKIQAAVITGTDWEGIPPELRKQADTPWFKSLLAYDPAKVMPRVRQPILIIQGDLDTQVPPAQSDRLGELARARKKAGALEVVHIAGINHLLVPATTGSVTEYGQLRDKAVSPKVAETIVDWLRKTL